MILDNSDSMRCYLLLFLCLLALNSPARAADAQAQFYHKAFKAIDDQDPQKAENAVAHGHDRILNKVLSGYAMALPGNDYGFGQMAAFIAANPSWPGLHAIAMIAEQKIPPTMPNSQIIAWFNKHPPVTGTGFNRYIEALNQTGDAQGAQSAIRKRWIDGDFTGDELESFYSKYGGLIDPGALWARLDRLLWKNDIVGARRIIPYVEPNDQLAAEARLALAANDGNGDRIAGRLPANAQNDSGLMYQRAKWRLHNNDDDDAVEMLLNAPADETHAEAWWNLREIEIRRALDRHDDDLAYRLTDIRGEAKAKVIVQSEFLAGWIALRFLNRPGEARDHFQNLYDAASTPITRARGAYWLGRAYEASDDKDAANQAFQDAAAFNTTYYGQLAAARIYTAPMLTAKADPPLPEAARRRILNQDLYRAIISLSEVGERDRAANFFHAAIDDADERAEFIVLTELAAKMHRPDLGIQTVKAANQKDMLVENGGFPLIDQRVPRPPEPAFTHALIRQESMFNPDASSGAGAVGLMQLMPRTAKDTAKHIGIRYSASRLTNPAYSLQLGTAFVQEQIDRFNGSYVLALAGYNAGPSRVREWIAAHGDPRNPDVDGVDWIEAIPINETRNYVQRILENIQIYRAKLAGGRAPLMIINDLKR